MHEQSCCFASLNLSQSKPIAFLTFSLTLPSSLLKLPIVFERGVTNKGTTNENGVRENEKWEQGREREMKLPMGLGFN